MSLIPVAKFSAVAASATGVVDTGGKFDFREEKRKNLLPVVHLDLRISPQVFNKIRNDPNVIFRA